jgi:hypothetical protein
MEIKYGNLKDSLSIKNLENLKVITLEDFGRDYQNNIHFPPGANQIEIILGSADSFSSIPEFLMHIFSIRYANGIEFNLPHNFFDRTDLLTEMDYEQFKLHIDAYFEGFFDHLYSIDVNLNFLKIQFNTNGYQEGYKISVPGTGQVLVCRTSIYYMHFISIAI